MLENRVAGRTVEQTQRGECTESGQDRHCKVDG
jgi:hypothetical protein